MEELLPFILLGLAGLVAGYINAMAGSGSLLTLPALIFTGLDGASANATNRIAVLIQCGVAAVAYSRRGFSWRDVFQSGPEASGGDEPLRLSPWLLLAVALGSSGLGAWGSGVLGERGLRQSLAAVMVVFLVMLLWPKKRAKETAPEASAATRSPLGPTGAILLMALIGAYAGFLQAGVGVAILVFLDRWHGGSLLAANAVKVALVFVMAIVSLLVFAAQGQAMDLLRGLFLGAATSAGAWVGVRAAVRGGERLVRAVLVLAVAASSVKLFWDLFTQG